MPTCCVCQGHYEKPESGERPKCTRCGADNTSWEQVRGRKFGDFIDTSGVFLSFPVIALFLPILLALIAIIVQREQLQSYGAILVTSLIIVMSVDALITWACYTVRFRIREDALFRKVAATKRPSSETLVVSVPVAALLVALILSLVLGWIVSLILNVLMAWLVAPLLGILSASLPLLSNVTLPLEMVVFLVYIFLFPSLFFSTMLFLMKRYVGSFDLPCPIFLDVPRMRTVVIDEYLAKLGDDTPRRGLEYRELKRTSQGGLSVTIMWKVEEKGDKGEKKEKTIKVTLESDPWARLLSAKEEADKS